MGLAASQARFFTITSRLSSIELKQQRIAMDKMRLANDQANIAAKYTAALNNKTLQFSNGSNGNLALNYSTLVDHGYAVMRLSDGVVAGSASGANGMATTAEEAKSSSNYVDPEILKWVGKSAPTRPVAPNKNEICGTEPQRPTQTLQKPIEYRNYTAPSADAVNSAISAYNSIGSSDANDENGTQQLSPVDAANNVLVAAGQYIANLKANGLEETYDYIYNDFTSASSQFQSARNTDYAEDAAAEAVQQVSDVMSEIVYMANDEASSKNLAVSSMTPEDYQAKLAAYNQNQADWANYETKYAQYQNNYNNVYQPRLEQYNKDLKQYNVDYRNWSIAQSMSAAEGTANAGTTATAGSYDVNSLSAKSFERELGNPQYLIQGLLNNQFVLMKNGQQVSLSSETSILEVDDESDDTKAEAEYNSEMRKTNNKEKILDMQSKAVETEYSALKTEYESVKSLISDHADKDFTLFS